MQFAHFEFDPDQDLLGEGPLSEVYKAVDTRLGRTVALKILRAHAEIDPAADQRFHREAQHTSQLEHPNIATVFEYGNDQGTSYIALEFLEGRTLDKILKEQALGYEECLRIAAQLTSALAAVHQNGLIHRDLKPGNLMVRDDGTVKLLDFGIARATNESSITQHGMLVGTVLYMSPEQVRGEDLDFRSDVFALGSVLYHMMTGKLAFPGKSFPEVCMAILDGEVRRPSEIRSGFPERLEEYLLRCIAPDPQDRFQSAGEAHGALISIGDSIRADLISPGTLEGTLAIPPVSCVGDDPGRCAEMAASLRLDLKTELDRIRGLQVLLIDSNGHAADAAGDASYDYVLRGRLAREATRGRFDVEIQHYERSAGQPRMSASWSETIAHEEADEWTLQADLVRSAARAVRRRLTEVSLKPTQLRRRDGQRARELSLQAHEVLLRGTTKHLMSAASLFRRAIDADGYCALAYAGLAEAMVRKYLYWDGDATFLDEAREHARRALALDPDCAEAHTSLGFAHHLSGHPADAQREYRLANQLDPDEWLAHRLLGSLLAREGNFKQAASQLRRAINLRPHHIGSYDHLYKVLKRLGRHEEADENADDGVAAARAHLQLVPDNQEARLHMGLLQARQGARVKAQEIAAAALEIAPKDGYTCFHVGMIFAILGDHPLAVENIRKARDRGFYVRSELITNPDLDSLRGLIEFQELLH
jgi:tetratricopeptide (TPR) repeat protein